MSIASQLSFSTATSLLAGAAGSIPYQASVSNSTFLAIGANGYVLTSNGSVPTWTVASGIASGQVQTVLQAGNATYYPTFVDSNNASATAESFYTTSTFQINPYTGNVGISASPITTATYRLNVANIIQVGGQGGSDVTQIGGGSGTGSFIRGYYGVDGSQAFNITGNGNSYVNASNAGGNFGIGNRSPQFKLDVGPVNSTQATNAGASGLIRNASGADLSPGTQARIIVYGGTGVDSSNWGYFGYDSNGLMKIVYGKSGSTIAQLAWGTTSASDGTGTFTETMRLDNNGRLGIGTTSPSALLHVSSGTNATLNYPTGTWAAKIYQQNDITAYNGLIVSNRWQADASTVFEVGNSYGSSTAWGSYRKITGIGTHTWGSGAAAIERMRLDSSGNLGIGSYGTDAGARVLVQNTGSQNTAWFRNFSGTRAASVEVSDWPYPVLALSAFGNFYQQKMLSFTLPNDAIAAGTGVYHTDDSVWNFALNGVTGANSWDNASGGTTPAQVSTTATGLQLLGPGNLRIGTTAANSIFFRVSNTDVAKVDPSGNMAVNRGLYVGSISGTQGVAGEIRATNEITAYYTSDARLKENIKQIEDPITMIDQIRGVYFDWTDEYIATRGGEDGYFVRKHDIGVIAQEIEAILPEIVATRDTGFKAVKYEKIVPLLIEAIKAQQKQIDQIQATLAELLNK